MMENLFKWIYLYISTSQTIEENIFIFSAQYFCLYIKKRRYFVSPLIPLNFTNLCSVVILYSSVMITDNEIHNICKYNKKMAFYRFENGTNNSDLYGIEEQFLFIIQFSTRIKDRKKFYFLCFQFDRFSYQKLIHIRIARTV